MYTHAHIYRNPPLGSPTRWIKSESDALGGIALSRGCFERCCSNKTTPLYHSNLSFSLSRSRRYSSFCFAYAAPSGASLMYTYIYIYICISVYRKYIHICILTQTHTLCFQIQAVFGLQRG